MAYRNKLKVWKISPGENAKLWTECRAGGYICIGWDNYGDLLQYKNSKELSEKIKENSNYEDDEQPTNITNNLWSFSHEINIGDIVIANKGTTDIVGLGIILSEYIPPKSKNNPRSGQGQDHKNIRKVKWLTIDKKTPVNWKLGKNLAVFTLHGMGVTIQNGKVIGSKSDSDRFCEIVKNLSLGVDNIYKQALMIIKKNELQNRYKYLLSKSNTSKQIILSGPPGTSKTFEAKQLAAYLLGFPPEAATDKDNEDAQKFEDKYFSGSGTYTSGAWAIIQFHPAYNYEDFVRGIQVSTPNGGGSPQYKTVNRIFAQMALLAYNNPTHKYVLIIDEINRAHLAAVLGELIYGLEYRGSKITSPYAVDNLSEQFDDIPNALIVPSNLYIIGTMNTADRSIGHIDYAVRRRFAFVPLLPDKDILENYYAKSPHLSYMSKAEDLFDAVEALFKGENNYLSPEFYADDVQPGHTYFMAETCEELANKFIYQVYPLLREYVKDGVLITKGGAIELEIKDKKKSHIKIQIAPVISVSELCSSIESYLSCSSGSIGENDSDEQTTTDSAENQEDKTEAQ